MEHEIRAFPIDADLENKLKLLAAEGWDIDGSMPPVAVYHLVKIPPVTVQEAVGTMAIDDTKVFILRNGKLI